MERKLIFRNVFGKKVNIKDEKGDNTGVINVVTLPVTGEAGRIYYNTTDNKYYIYEDGAFTEFGAVVNPEIEIVANPQPSFADVSSGKDDSDSEEETETENEGEGEGNDEPQTIIVQYNIEPNKYYMFGTRTSAFKLNFTLDNTYAKQYLGRFTASGDSVSLVLPANVHIPDDMQPDIEDDHTYEFNILHDICLITDITYTTTIPVEPKS